MSDFSFAIRVTALGIEHLPWSSTQRVMARITALDVIEGPPVFEVVDVAEWADLAVRLCAASPAKYDELVKAMRKIVELNELMALDPFGRPEETHVHCYGVVN